MADIPECAAFGPLAVEGTDLMLRTTLRDHQHAFAPAGSVQLLEERIDDLHVVVALGVRPGRRSG
jgi:hypothetical protein